MSAPMSGPTNTDEKTWALIAHGGGAAGAFLGAGGGGWIAPLVALLVKGNESPTVRAHAVSALNFQILVTIVAIVGWITACFLIGFVFIFAAWAVGTIFGIIATLKVNDGQPYKYPFTIPVVK